MAGDEGSGSMGVGAEGWWSMAETPGGTRARGLAMEGVAVENTTAMDWRELFWSKLNHYEYSSAKL